MNSVKTGFGTGLGCLLLIIVVGIVVLLMLAAIPDEAIR